MEFYKKISWIRLAVQLLSNNEKKRDNLYFNI